jgi:hypothetical protein
LNTSHDFLPLQSDICEEFPCSRSGEHLEATLGFLIMKQINSIPPKKRLYRRITGPSDTGQSIPVYLGFQDQQSTILPGGNLSLGNSDTISSAVSQEKHMHHKGGI